MDDSLFSSEYNDLFLLFGNRNDVVLSFLYNVAQDIYDSLFKHQDSSLVKLAGEEGKFPRNRKLRKTKEKPKKNLKNYRIMVPCHKHLIISRITFDFHIFGLFFREILCRFQNFY